MPEEQGNSYTELQSRAQSLLDSLAGILSGDGFGLEGLFPPMGDKLPLEEGMPTPSPFSYNSLNQQNATDFPIEGEVNPTEQFNQVKETANSAKESAEEGIRRANTAQSTANSALAKALSAMSVAQQARSIARSANTSAVADSDAETPPYVSNGGGPQ